jgi:hypothetical protein
MLQLSLRGEPLRPTVGVELYHLSKAHRIWPGLTNFFAAAFTWASFAPRTASE